MTLYNVHIYREVHLTYESIEADTAHTAVVIALDKSVAAADDIDDCDGEAFIATIDIAGDDAQESAVTIDFEPERRRQAVRDLLEALRGCLFALDEHEDGFGPSKQTAIKRARAAITKATAQDRDWR